MAADIDGNDDEHPFVKLFMAKAAWRAKKEDLSRAVCEGRVADAENHYGKNYEHELHQLRDGGQTNEYIFMALGWCQQLFSEESPKDEREIPAQIMSARVPPNACTKDNFEGNDDSSITKDQISDFPGGPLQDLIEFAKQNDLQFVLGSPAQKFVTDAIIQLEAAALDRVQQIANINNLCDDA